MPTVPSLDAVLLGADCEVRSLWRTHQRIMICLCVCTVKTVNGDEMNQGPISKYGTAISKYGTASGVGLLSKLFASIRLHIHFGNLISHCVCSVFMRFATHCDNY